MNYRFQILILVLMLWSLGANHAMHWSMHDRNKKEPECNRNNFLETLPSTTAQLIDNIDPEDRTKIQMAALVASGPEIGVTIFEAVAATRLLRKSKYADRAYISKSADEIRLVLAKKDLQGFDDAWNFVRTHPKGADAWEDMIFSEYLRRNKGALEAKTLPKGTRPDPNTYLDANYITSHLSNFNNGVVKFSANVPTGTIGPPGGTFVLSKNQADQIILNSNGNVNKLEEFLGLNPGDLGTNPVRIDVSNPSGIRMPTGNELGANEKWIPGGQTSGGVLEATVDQIQPGTYSHSFVF